MAKSFKYLLLTKSVGLALNALAIFFPKKAAKIGYRLHSEPRIGKLNKHKLPAVLENSEKNKFDLDGINYQSYTWHGNSEIILLAHGWESNAARWELLLPHLIKTGKTIVAIDAPAHGLSGDASFSVPKYAKVIHGICQMINPTYLIGHSIGGAACVYYQFKYQNLNIKKMVLLGAPADLQVLIDNFCSLLSLSTKMKDYLVIEFGKQINFSVKDFSAMQFGAAINTPALVIHDKQDAVVAFAESQKIIRNWQNATFIESENLGHSMHNDNLYQKITAYIKT